MLGRSTISNIISFLVVQNILCDLVIISSPSTKEYLDGHSVMGGSNTTGIQSLEVERDNKNINRVRFYRK